MASRNVFWVPVPRGRFLFFLLIAVLLLAFHHFATDDGSVAQVAKGAKVAEVAPQSAEKNKKPRITIVTFTTQEHSYTYLSLKNKHAYARKHGYDLVIDYEVDEPRGVMWHKLNMLETVMASGKADWIWWIDFDTLITNSTIELADIVIESLANQTQPNGIDFLLTADCFQLNAGSMLVRSAASSLNFLNKVRDYGDKNRDLSEQDCIRDVINQSTDQEKKQALWIPQWKMNAFPEEIRCWMSQIEDGKLECLRCILLVLGRTSRRMIRQDS